MPGSERDPDELDWTTGADLPAADSGFVDAVVARLLADPDVKFACALAQHRVPDPPAGFVDEVMARVAPAPAPAVSSPRGWGLAAAAGLLLAAGLWWMRTPAPVEPTATPAYASATGSLAHFATVHPHDDAPDFDGFFRQVAFDDGDGVLLVAEGAR